MFLHTPCLAMSIVVVDAMIDLMTWQCSLIFEALQSDQHSKDVFFSSLSLISRCVMSHPPFSMMLSPPKSVIPVLCLMGPPRGVASMLSQNRLNQDNGGCLVTHPSGSQIEGLNTRCKLWPSANNEDTHCLFTFNVDYGRD